MSAAVSAPNLSPRARTLLERIRAAAGPLSLGIVRFNMPTAERESIDTLDELLRRDLVDFVTNVPRKRGEIIVVLKGAR